MTDAGRVKKRPLLFYLFAEPTERSGHTIAAEDRARHRKEIEAFASAVDGDEVEFRSASYREWLANWPASGDARHHADALLERFNP